MRRAKSSGMHCQKREMASGVVTQLVAMVYRRAKQFKTSISLRSLTCVGVSQSRMKAEFVRVQPIGTATRLTEASMRGRIFSVSAIAVAIES